MNRSKISRNSVRRSGDGGGGSGGVTSVTASGGLISSGGATPDIHPAPGFGAGQDFIHYRSGLHVPGTSAPPGWDRYYPWGWVQVGNNSGATSLPLDEFFAMPMYFTRPGTVNNIGNWQRITAGVPGTTIDYVWSIYANLADGLVFPGAKLIQSAPVTMLPATPISTIWTPNFHVDPGILYWFVPIYHQTAGPADSVTFVSAIKGNSNPMGLLGSVGTGTFSNSFSDTPTSQTAFRVNVTYNPVLPDPFPQTGTFTFYPDTTPGAETPYWVYNFTQD